MVVDDLFVGFTRETGVALALNGAGRARLRVDDQYTIDFEWDEAGRALHVYTAVSEVRPDQRPQVFALALEMNLFLRETLGATLAFDETTAELLLCRRLDLDATDVARLIRALDDLVNAAAHARQRVLTGAQAATPSEGMAAFSFLGARA